MLIKIKTENKIKKYKKELFATLASPPLAPPPGIEEICPQPPTRLDESKDWESASPEKECEQPGALSKGL